MSAPSDAEARKAVYEVLRRAVLEKWDYQKFNDEAAKSLLDHQLVTESASGWTVVTLVDSDDYEKYKSQVRHVLADAKRAQDAWHIDRTEWMDRALRSSAIAHAGGATALAALIGTLADDGPLPQMLFWSLASFLVGLILAMGYPLWRFSHAEYRVWYLRFKRKDPNVGDYPCGPGRVRTQRPPTRPQLFVTYGINIVGFLLFVVGLILAILSIYPWFFARCGAGDIILCAT